MIVDSCFHEHITLTLPPHSQLPTLPKKKYSGLEITNHLPYI